jgi:hypothetical protein
MYVQYASLIHMIESNDSGQEKSKKERDVIFSAYSVLQYEE